MPQGGLSGSVADISATGNTVAGLRSDVEGDSGADEFRLTADLCANHKLPSARHASLNQEAVKTGPVGRERLDTAERVHAV
jgi:hypothetical protein